MHPLIKILHSSRIIFALLTVFAVFSTVAPRATAQQFGAFAPQYQTFEWRAIESRSFNVYHHQGGAYLGQYAAATLEESFKVIQRTLGVTFNEKLDVIVYNSPNGALQTNAREFLLPRNLQGVTDVRRNRIIVAFSGDWYEFKRSLARELVHGVLNSLVHGAVLPSPVGGLFDLPIWFSDGLAEFLSNDGAMTVETEMALRDAMLNDRFTTFSALDPTLRVPIGHAFFWYVSEKFGAGRISEFLTRIRGLRSMENAFRSTFGLSMDGFSSVWRRDLKEIFKADMTKFEDVEKIATRITDTDKDGSTANSDPVWSPVNDKLGEKFAYLSAQGGVWQVMVQFEGKQKRLERVLNTGRTFDAARGLVGKGASLLSWKPDGTQLAAVVSGGSSDAVVLINIASGAQLRLEPALENILSITFAPDGKSLVLSASENELPNLYLYDIATKRLTKLTNDIFTETEPTWSPDGKTLYFLSDRTSTLTLNTSSATAQMWEHAVQSSDVYALNLAAKRIERLTTTPQERKTSLSVTPDGKRLWYVSDRNGIYNLFDYNLVAKTLTPRTSLLAGLREFGFTKDGSKMTFSALKKGGFNIFTLSAPLDRKIKDPDVTELRKQSIERESAAEKALGRVTVPSVDGTTPNAESGIIVQNTPDTLRGYGKIDLTLENQKMVTANPEVLAQAARQEAVEAGDYTVPGKYPSVPLEYNLGLTSWLITPSFDTFFAGRSLQSQVSLFGNFGLSAHGLWMDALGNHRLFAQANVMFNWNNNDIFLSYSYLPELIDYEVQIFRTARENFVIDQREAVLSLLSYWGGAFKATLPLSSSLRMEGKLSAVNMLRNSIDPAASRVNRSEFMLSPEVRMVLDNTETGFFGPASGSRGFVQIDGVPGMAGLSFARLMGDFRQYIPIKNILTIVGRVTAGTNFGGTPQNFLAGGQENTVLGRSIGPDILPFNRAEDLYFTQPVMPMRAFSIADAQGQNFALVNVEARVSLLQSENSSAFLNSILNGLQGVAFVDIGSAWTNTLRLNAPKAIFDTFGQYVGLTDGDVLMSLGVGVRTYLLGQYPVKIDVAWQNLQGGIMLPRLIVGFGYNF
jgi:Tol biopolymer transport system component